DREQDLRVLQEIKRRVSDRFVRDGRTILRRTVEENLPARGPDDLEPSRSDGGAREAQRSDEIVGVRLVDFPFIEGRRVEREVARRLSTVVLLTATVLFAYVPFASFPAQKAVHGDGTPDGQLLVVTMCQPPSTRNGHDPG